MHNIEITRKAQIIRIEGEDCAVREDLLIAEYPFTLYGNERFIRVFNCTPCSSEELAELCEGALFTLGLIRCREDIVSMNIDEEKGEGYVTFTEGLESIQMIQMPQTTQMVQTTQMTQTTQTPQTTLAVKGNGPETEITVDEIHRMMRENLVPTRLFEETGGVHMVSLYNISDGTRLLKKEDAARHNAVDKVIGAALRQQVCFGNTALVLSGRVSLEILRKAETAGIRVVLSKAAPTDQSVEAADEAGITLIGFIREGRMNIYTHPQRVSLPDKLYAQIARERRTETVRKSRYL